MTPEVVFRSPGLSARRCPLARADLVRAALAELYPAARWKVFVTSATVLTDRGTVGGEMPDGHESLKLLRRWADAGLVETTDDGLRLLEPATV